MDSPNPAIDPVHTDVIGISGQNVVPQIREGHRGLLLRLRVAVVGKLQQRV